MVAETPDWPYWWTVADTRVKLSQCIALSLNVNPLVVPPHYIDKAGLSHHIEKMGFPRHIGGIRFPDWESVDAFRKDFRARLSILATYRKNGECFSADAPGRGERSVLLREFAEWASHKFTEPPFPKELEVLAAIGDRPLPAPQELANMVAAGHTQFADFDPGEVHQRDESETSKTVLRDIQKAYDIVYERTGKVPSQRKVAEESGYDRGTESFKKAFGEINKERAAKTNQNQPHQPAKSSQH